jgi:hypothetical protein
VYEGRELWYGKEVQTDLVPRGVGVVAGRTCPHPTPHEGLDTYLPHHNSLPSHTLHPLAYEDGTDTVSRNVGH